MKMNTHYEINITWARGVSIGCDDELAIVNAIHKGLEKKYGSLNGPFSLYNIGIYTLIAEDNENINVELDDNFSQTDVNFISKLIAGIIPGCKFGWVMEFWSAGK